MSDAEATTPNPLQYEVEQPKGVWRKPLAIALALIAVCTVLIGFARGVSAIHVMESMYPNRAEGRFTFVLLAVNGGQTLFGGLAITLNIISLLLQPRGKIVWLLAALTLVLTVIAMKALGLYFQHAMNLHGYVEIG